MLTVPLKQGFDGRNFVITLKRYRRKIGGRNRSIRTEFYLRCLCVMINSFFSSTSSLLRARVKCKSSDFSLSWALIKLTDGQPLEINVINQKFFDRKIGTRQFKNKTRYRQYLRPHVLINLYFFVSGKCHVVHSTIWFGMYVQILNIFNVTSLHSTVWMYASMMILAMMTRVICRYVRYWNNCSVKPNPRLWLYATLS